jgi:hypothetical protein
MDFDVDSELVTLAEFPTEEEFLVARALLAVPAGTEDGEDRDFA